MNKKARHFSSKKSKQDGVYTVELTLSLLFFVVFVLIFWEYTAAFIAHQRVTYAAFMAERSRVVGGNPIKVAMDLKGGQVYVGDDRVLVRDELDLPLNLIKPWGGDAITYVVSREVSMPREPEDFGDNMWMPVEPMGGTIPDFGPDPIEQLANSIQDIRDPNPDKSEASSDDSNSEDESLSTDEFFPIDECLLAKLGESTKAQSAVSNEEISVGEASKSNQCEEEGNPQMCPVAEVGAQNLGFAQKSAGNPINVTNGNKYQREVDLSYGGSETQIDWYGSGYRLPQANGQSYSGRLSLLFSRHYNSVSERESVMGVGWQHSYQVRLGVDRVKLPNDQGDEIRLRQSDGRLISFIKQTDRTRKGIIYRSSNFSDGWLLAEGRGYRWFWLDGRELRFDGLGLLTRVSVPNGDAVTLYYDNRLRLIDVTDAQGRELKLHYKANKIAKVVGPDGEQVHYKYSDTDQLIEVKYADNSTRRYHYEDSRDPYNLTGLTDERDIRYASWEYDDQDRAIMSTHADGVGKVMLKYDESKGQTIATDSLQRVSTYTWQDYDGTRLIKRIDGPGCSSCGRGDVEYEYNENLQIIKKSTRAGLTLEYNYDTHGRRTETKQISRTGSSRYLSKLIYPQQHSYSVLNYLPIEFKEPSVKANSWHQYKFKYNEYGQLLSLSEQGYRPNLDTKKSIKETSVVGIRGFELIQRHTNYQYNGKLKLVAIDGPKEDVDDTIYYTYNKTGLRDGAYDANNNVISKVLEFDKAGRVLKYQKNGLLPIEHYYDNRGRIIKRRKGEIVSEQNYLKNGLVESLQTPEGIITRYRYNAAGLMVAEILPDGEIREFKYNSEEQVLGSTLSNPSNEILRRNRVEYDDQGRAIKSFNAQDIVVNETVYDERGQIVSRIDGNGMKEFYEYDQWIRPSLAKRADGSEINYQYDDQNQLVRFTDGRGNDFYRWYDDFRLKVYEHHPDTGWKSFTYNKVNNLIKQYDTRKDEISYQYDSRGRKQSIQYPNAQVNYHYDRHSQLTEVSGFGTNEQYIYNSYGDWLKHTRNIDGLKFTTNYDYNEKTGQLISKTLLDGQILTYEYFSKGQNKGKISSIKLKDGNNNKAVIKNIQYHSSNQKILKLGNDLSIDYNFNLNARLNKITSNPVFKASYTFDPNRNVIEDNINQSQTSYGYDELNRLIQFNSTSMRQTYLYDSQSNRMREENYNQDNDKLWSKDFNYVSKGSGNRLLSINRYQENDKTTNTNYNIKLEYDNRGNMVKINDKRLSYDRRNQLVEYTEKGKTSYYQYNANRERIKKKTANGTYYYLYNKGRIEAEYALSDNTWTHYVYFEGRVIAQINDKTIMYLHTDRLGTPRVATNEKAEIIWSIEMDAFGQTSKQIGNQADVKLRFQGQYYDQESGLHYNWNRYYYPQLGRYITSDPIGIAGGINTYLYANANTLAYVDPTGLRFEPPSKCELCKEWMQRNLKDMKWLDKLPDCPCAVLSVRDKPNWNYKRGDNTTVQDYHPGADGGCARSTSEDNGIAKGSAQQCCYDRDGALITSGAAAGTPDKYAAEGFGILSHYFEDVNPHTNCGWQKYNQIRKPNNGKNCQENEI